MEKNGKKTDFSIKDIGQQLESKKKLYDEYSEMLKSTVKDSHELEQMHNIHSETHDLLKLCLDILEKSDHHLMKLCKKMFGTKSEKIVKDADKALNPVDELETDIEKETKYPSKPTKKHDDFNFDALPQEDVYLEQDTTCPSCHQEMTSEGESVQRTIEFIPSRFKVVNYHQPSCVCKQCSDIDGNFLVNKGEVNTILPKSYLTSSLLSHFAVSKYILHIPFYRLVKHYNDEGLNFNRNTIYQGLKTITELYLKYIYDEMVADFRASSVKYSDETTVKLLSNKGRSSIFLVSCLEPYNICLFIVEPSATREAFKKIIGEQKSLTYLMCDAKNIYNDIDNVKPVLCYAHMRRYFYDLNSDAVEIVNILEKIGTLFHEDKMLKEKSRDYQHFKELRKEHLENKVNELFDYMRETRDKFLNRALILKAYDYALTKEEGFKAFLEDGRLELSNNHSERLAKTQVLGRKNWLHMNNINSASISGMLCSILQTANFNNLDPYSYLEYLIKELATGNIKKNELKKYLPYAKQMKEMFSTNELKNS